MLKKGFTLIELLIVITIIAILAGSAIPYVQDYVDDAKLARVQEDLNELKNALIRYELDRGSIWDSAASGTLALVGPYLAKPLSDPWGSQYFINGTGSFVLSPGADRIVSNADDIKVDFRPPLALSRAYWEDTITDGIVSNGDTLTLKFTRPVGTAPAANAGLTFSLGVATAYAYTIQTDPRLVKVAMTTMTTPFQAGRSTLTLSNAFLDHNGKAVNASGSVLIKAQN